MSPISSTAANPGHATPHRDAAPVAVKRPASERDGVVIDLCAHFATQPPADKPLDFDLTAAEWKQVAEWQAYLRDARECDK